MATANSTTGANLTPNIARENSDDWGDFVSSTTTNQSSSNPSLPQLAQNGPLQTTQATKATKATQTIQTTQTIDSRDPNASTKISHHAEAEGSGITPADTLPQLTAHIQPGPLEGFDTLDPVQRYAIGALAVVLLNRHANDLNGVAFARTQSLAILEALHLRPGQQEAILALDPSESTRDAVVLQCVSLVGALPHRFRALQAMLALAVVTGQYDARSRAFLAAVADEFGIDWPTIAAVELAVSVHLFEHHAPKTMRPTNIPELHDAYINATDELHPNNQNQFGDAPHHIVNTTTADIANSANDTPRAVEVEPHTKTKPPSVGDLLIQRRKKKQRVRKAIKIGGITLVGGMLFGLTGGLIAPALLSALAGVGVASAAGLAASGSLASGAVVGGLFGVAGGGFTLRKARNRVSTNLEEFDFERPDDPRVIQERERKAEREKRKLEKLVAQRLAEEAASNNRLAIQASESVQDADLMDVPDGSSEKELPRQSPPPSDDDLDNDSAEDSVRDGTSAKKFGRFGKSRGKREKLKVGARGLEAAAAVPGLHVCICVPAWLTSQGFGSSLDQFEAALKAELPCSQHIAVRWESRRLHEMGLAFAKFWASKATVTTLQQAYPHAIAAASSVAGAVAFAFAIPLTVMSCMDYIDNPWSILVSRSNGAGEELADVLVERSYGHRPVTLFGYSIGARVIFKCLESLASRGANGIVENVFLMGAAVSAEPDRWKRVRGVVAGRIVNGYGIFDWALAFFHRGCGHGVYVSGLRRVEVDCVENLNMAYLGIEGHRELKDSVPRVMHAMGIGLGYITMPPAKLVVRGGLPISSDNGLQDGAVCEEPGGEDWGDVNCSTPDIVSVDGDAFSSPESSSSDSVSLPKPLGMKDASNPPEKEVNGKVPSGNQRRDVSGAKASKSKSWLSWRTWSSSSSKVKLSKANKKTLEKRDNPFDKMTGVESVRMEDMDMSDANGEWEKSRFGEKCDTVEPGCDDTAIEMGHGADMLAQTPNAVVADDEVDGQSKDEETFDWEKQKEIWAEQERQIHERGYADSAGEISMRRKVVLTISVEVAGRRLERFIEQDAQLPVVKKEVVFTNCVDQQRGMHIRIYEHEKQTKTLPYNMLKSDKKYPKMISELDLRLRRAAVKGKLRVAVCVWSDNDGNVYAFAEERFADGSVADRSECCVPRSELCTFEERSLLEEAEQKRLEAQVDAEMHGRSTRPALLAPGAEQRSRMGSRDFGGSDGGSADKTRQAA